MANSEHWDTGTTATTEEKGPSRIYNKISGSWNRQSEIFTKVGGAWKQVNKAWIKASDAWEPVYWAPEIGETLTYAQCGVHSSQASDGGQHWAQFYPTAKYLGGDPFDLSSWDLYYLYEWRLGGEGENPGPHTRHWNPVNGVTTSNNGAAPGPASTTTTSTDTVTYGNRGWFRIGGVEPYSTSTYNAAPFGAFCPVFHALGGGGGAGLYSRASFDNYTELRLYAVASSNGGWLYDGSVYG